MLNLTPRYTSTRIDELPAELQPLAAQSLTLARLYAGRGITQPDELRDATLCAIASRNATWCHRSSASIRRRHR